MIAATMSGQRGEQTGEMIPMLLRHEIQVLPRAGHAQADVAARTGVSVRAVRRILAEDAVTRVDDEVERRDRNVARLSRARREAQLDLAIPRPMEFERRAISVVDHLDIVVLGHARPQTSQFLIQGPQVAR